MRASRVCNKIIVSMKCLVAFFCIRKLHRLLCITVHHNTINFYTVICTWKASADTEQFSNCSCTDTHEMHSLLLLLRYHPFYTPRSSCTLSSAEPLVNLCKVTHEMSTHNRGPRAERDWTPNLRIPRNCYRVPAIRLWVMVSHETRLHFFCVPFMR